ncbi:hypothetical protein [Anabaena catenula]|nr:hypothetical protein [Anabaena catenula]
MTNHQSPITNLYVPDAKTSAEIAFFLSQVTLCGGEKGQLSR